MEKVKNIFISHAEEEMSIATEIKKYFIRNDIDVFLAGENLRVGDKWEFKINEAIKSCDVFVLIWSENSSASHWVHSEIATAFRYAKDIFACTCDHTAHHALIKRYQIVPWNSRNPPETINEIACKLGTLSYQDTYTTTDDDFGAESAIEIYKKELRTNFSEIKILGSEDPQSLQDVYIPLFLSKVNDDSNNPEPIIPHDIYEKNKVNRIVVLGHPGTGKTTLLRYLTYLESTQERRYLPIYIRLNNRFTGFENLTDLIFAHIKAITNKTIARQLVDKDDFGGDDTLVLFDGLDELTEEGQLEFVKKLNVFTTHHPRSNILISSRVSNFSKGVFHGGGYQLFQLRELSGEDIKGYIEKYASTGLESQLWDVINRNDRLFTLAQIPFLLAMICVAQYDLASVRDRTTLFSKCTRYLLGLDSWDEGKSLRHDDSEENIKELELAIKTIAVHFYKLDSNGIFDISELEFVVNQVRVKQDALEIIDKIVLYSGLLQKVDNKYQFVHRSIWEYFVALGMNSEESEQIMSRSGVALWEEPIRLYIGLTNSENLDKILDGFWNRNKGLTLRAMTDLPDFPTEKLNQLIEVMNQPERVRMVFEILDTVAKYPNTKESNRILLDSLSALLRVERNCEVLYHCIVALSSRNDPGCDMMINNVLDIKNVEYRRRKYFADSEYFFKFIDIPNGSYKMGLDDAPDNREKPAVNVQISDFKISPYLVTNKLFYEDFPFSENRTDLYSGANSQPVNNVTWYDAIVFAWWLGCDLPTEAEWEYACRAGGADDTILFNPNEIPNYAWYGENSENVTHVVGGLKPNSWGLYDMLGNVREWVKDWYSENIYEEYNAIGTIIDPIGPSNGELKVLRGGVFDWALTHLRPTYRPMNPPQNRFFGNGIRLVTRPHRGNLYDGSTFLHDDYTKAETDK